MFCDIVLYLFLFLIRFRWVFCQLEILRHCFPPSVRRILAELPETLDATYERILQEIPKTNRVYTRRLLQCLTVAARPLAVEELAEVLAIDFDAAGGIPKLNEGFRWADQEKAVLSACSSLVAIVEDGNSRRVQFSHFSVKEFLTSDRLAASDVDVLRGHHIRLEPAHTIMAQACLSVLLRLDDHMDKETIESYPLARYAGNFVFAHAMFEDVLSHINDGLDYFLDQDKPHFNTWFLLERADFDSKEFDVDLEFTSDSSESLSDSPSSTRPLPAYPPRASLFYYALIGNSEALWLAQLLISKRPRDLDVINAFGHTPLHIAVHTDDSKVLLMLIERTTNINGQDNKGCTPLHHAMCEGEHEHSARLLLDHGANVDAQNNNGTTPLHLAVSRMSEEIVQLLIENTTNIDLRNNKGQTALHKASKRGDLDIIRLILNHDAEVDALDNDGSTPLHLAISETEADPEVVELLLKHGANINLRNNIGQTAIHRASQCDDPDIMQLILYHSADVNALDNENSTPLHLAISKANLKVVQLLLNHDASVTLQNDKGQAALHRASQSGHSDIIQLILNHNADVDALDNEGSTPLHLAIAGASMDAVQLLLNHGASVHVQNNRGETPFQAASARGLEEITWLLSHSDSDRAG